jgi:hypothetical protein
MIEQYKGNRGRVDCRLFAAVAVARNASGMVVMGSALVFFGGCEILNVKY